MIIILSDASLATVGSVCGSQTGELRAQKTYLGEGGGGGCKDGSDLYRPIIVKAEETGSQPSQPDNNEQRGDEEQSGDDKGEELSTTQVWKTRPVQEEDFNQKKEQERAKYRKDSSTGLWMIPESNPFKVPSVTKEDFEKGPRAGELKWENDDEIWRKQRKVEWVNFYKSDNYAKDETTNRMMAPVTKETCKTTDGFVCKVRLGVNDNIFF